MTPTKLGTVIRLVLIGVVAGCAIALGAVFVVLHSSWVLGRVARTLGYEVSARTVSLSPSLSGSISGLSIKSLRDDGLTLVASNLTTKNSLDMLLRGEVDTLLLENPKLTFRIGKGAAGLSGLSILERLPNVRQLDIRNAEARLTLADGQQHIQLTGANATVRNFSPKTGGRIAVETSFTLTGAGAMTVAASGRVTASFELTGVYPRPYGKGTVELTVDSGAYTSGGRTLSLSGLRFATEVVYDRQTETLSIPALRGDSKDLGVITGTARAELRGDTPWSAHLSVASVDLAQLFTVIKPFLPAEYHAWTTQGTGAVDTELRGTYAAGRPSFNGTVTVSFRQGGFSSPDSTKAAQGVSGKVILKLRYASPEPKLAFNVRGSGRDGEYLWGKYYVNLAGREASLETDGTLSWGGGRERELSGSLDLFQTGKYAFSASGTGDDWTLRLAIADVSHERLVETLLKDSLKGLSPGLSNLSVSGTSALDAVFRRAGAVTTIAGTYRMAGGTFLAPDMQLAIQGVEADVPFDLAYPSPDQIPSRPPTPGVIRLAAIQRRRLAIESLQIPLIIARNTLEIPEPLVVPFFGGKIRLYGVRVDDLPGPRRYHFGVEVEGVDLGRLTRRVTGTEYPGVVNADFGRMTYEGNRLTSEGRAVIRVFGGEIQATNFFAENLASPAQRIGGDITFSNISLDEVTKKITIGRMTGIIRGSLRNFVMEYGEPASFTLEVESVETPGVAQQISTDAIQSISILGTGAGSALNRGITSFFREYPYSKIGVRCVLRNDEFSVNGTIHEGGKEYLVRRAFLRGVDVVNRNPNNVISFRDMEERIRRISRPREAPVVGTTVE